MKTKEKGYPKYAQNNIKKDNQKSNRTMQNSHLIRIYQQPL